MSTDLHTLAGAYAIDAVSSEECDAFRTHLADCQACRDEVRELRDAAALMGASEALRPPAQLRSRVLAAVDQTPQLPPVITPRRPGTTQARRFSRPRMLIAAAAAVVVAAVGVGVTQLGHRDEPVMAASVSKVFEAPDVHKAEVDIAKRGAVRVAVSQSLHEMAVDTEKLKAPGNGLVYQLWTMHDGQAVSAGLLSDIQAGASMEIPAPGTQVAITVEPSGGSPEPTTPPIVTVDPASV